MSSYCIFPVFAVIKAPDKSNNNKPKDENSPLVENNHVSRPDSQPAPAASNSSSVGW